MRVLFVGATGAVGQRVVPLLAPDFDLVLAARYADEVAGLPVQGVDIRDFEATAALLQASGADAVVNCAIADYRMTRERWDTAARHAYHESTIEVNVRGAYHLYEAAARAGISKFVFISSMTVVTGNPRYESLAGDEPPRPRNVYACTKLFGEQVGAVYAAEHGMSVTCLRLGQPFPLGYEQEEAWMADVTARSIFVHVEDIAAATAGALRETESFSAYSVVSASDAPWLEDVTIPALDYSPRYRFTPYGASLREPFKAVLG